jgi:hypothetical protein
MTNEEASTMSDEKRYYDALNRIATDGIATNEGLVPRPGFHALIEPMEIAYFASLVIDGATLERAEALAREWAGGKTRA